MTSELIQIDFARENPLQGFHIEGLLPRLDPFRQSLGRAAEKTKENLFGGSRLNERSSFAPGNRTKSLEPSAYAFDEIPNRLLNRQCNLDITVAESGRRHPLGRWGAIMADVIHQTWCKHERLLE